MTVVAVPGGLRAAVAGIVRLALPVSLSRAGILLLIVVDTAMVGGFSSLELAHYGLANAIQTVLMLVGVGMLIGTAVLCAQALGAGEPAGCGEVWRQAMRHSLVLGGLFCLACLVAEPFLLATGQAADLAAGGAGVALYVGLGMPGILLFVAGTLFLETLGRPLPAVAAMALANLANVPLNALLIHGGAGLPAMGAEGAALATAAVRWLAAAVIVVAILRLPDRDRLGLGPGAPRIAGTGRRLRRLGYPMSIATGLESAAFSSLTLFAGHIGAMAVAGWQITLNVIAFAFMAAIGIGTATAVHVGHAVGRGDLAGVRLAGWGGLLTILSWMGLVALALLLVPDRLAALFTADAAVLALAVPALTVAAGMVMADGAQGVLMGALRGAGDVWLPTFLHLLAFTVVMLPAAWIATFTLDLGVPGLVAAAMAGVAVASVLLAARFALLTRRPIRRI